MSESFETVATAQNQSKEVQGEALVQTGVKIPSAGQSDLAPHVGSGRVQALANGWWLTRCTKSGSTFSHKPENVL